MVWLDGDRGNGTSTFRPWPRQTRSVRKKERKEKRGMAARGQQENREGQLGFQAFIKGR
jgi:hypothetical protein